jgi:hypothetical protein
MMAVSPASTQAPAWRDRPLRPKLIDCIECNRGVCWAATVFDEAARMSPISMSAMGQKLTTVSEQDVAKRQ